MKKPIYLSTAAGGLAAFFILLLMGSALATLLQQAPQISLTSLWQDTYLRYITWFSLKQALLSTLLSVGLALPVAIAFFRHDFIGKTWLLKLFSMTLVLPVLIGVFGLLAIYGNSGLLAGIAAFFGLAWQPSIYGLEGILLAHVFFNLPFCTQLLVQALRQVPTEQRRLALQLGIQGFARFRVLELPYLRAQLVHCCGLVFILCFTSFATVMALGGGPKATTIELAIYQAIRFDFDLATAALLALWQLFLCLSIHLFLHRFSAPLTSQTHELSPLSLPTAPCSRLEKTWNTGWILFALALSLPPLIAVILQGINPKSLSLLAEPALWQACLHSLIIASASAVIALGLGIVIVLASRRFRANKQHFAANGIEMAANTILVVPSLVLATGLFLLLRETAFFADTAGGAISPMLVVVLVNSLMALPYVIKTLSSPAFLVFIQYDKLCRSLGISGISRLGLVEWRTLRQPIANAAAISFVLSAGDLSAIALFGSQDFQTLPFYLFSLMASYRMQEAAAAAFVLLALSFISYLLIEKTIHRHKKGQRC